MQKMTNRDKLSYLSDVDFSEIVIEKICELMFREENTELDPRDAKAMLVVNFEHWLCSCSNDKNI